MGKTVRRACSLCDVGCGLKLEVENNRVISVAPDHEDPHSQGYICPKGMAIADLHHDPDRLRQPMRRQADGTFRAISWEEAFQLTGERLRAVRAQHGADAIAVYFGNPLVHNYSGVIAASALIKAIGTKNRTSAGSQDTSPRFAASYYLYGNILTTPVPDVDRTDYFLCIGGNPAVSQGSAMITPNVKSLLRAIRERGGKVVTVDPRASETSKLADDHVFIRPGRDAEFLLSLLHELHRIKAIRRDALERDAIGWEAIEPRLAPFTPARVATRTGVPAATVERIARELSQAQRPVVYTRLGTCNSECGTLATWANDVVNIALGRLGEEGGAMFAEAPLDGAQFAEMGGMNGHARWHSRVRGLPETGCDLPASILAEEIETGGKGQVRALVTIAGNPVLSTPNGTRLAAALEKLDFMVAIDLYLNESSRHADLVLPPCWSLADDHSEPLTPGFALHGHARWYPPVVEREPGELSDWDILMRLAEEMGGGPLGMKVADWFVGVAAKLGFRLTSESMLDMLFRIGPHGDRYLPWSTGINLAKVKASPYGIDLGRARPGIRLHHRDKKVHLSEGPFLAAIDDLARKIEAESDDSLMLIGRRELRTNNSWMHNLPSLVAGRERCVLFVHPNDAARAGLRDSEPALLTSRTHSGTVPVRVTDEVMEGVVSLPHGWGHAPSAPWQQVAGAHPGVSANDFTDDQRVEAIVGQSILNGVPVRISPVDAMATA